MLAQLQPVAAATAGDAELALSTLLRARRGAAGSPSDQLDSLLAEAAAGGEGLEADDREIQCWLLLLFCVKIDS